MGVTICSLVSGSSGNATLVATGTTSILVDCGASAREVVARMAAIGEHPSQLHGILITHAHTDHYRSAGTLHARFGVPVYADPSILRPLARRGNHTSWRRVREPRPIPQQIGDLEVEALDTTHGYPPDDGRTVAYHLIHGRTRIAVVTDLGSVPESMISRLRGVKAIVLEANYDETILERKLSDPAFAMDWHYLRWVQGAHGHLSNQQCAEALAEIVTSPSCHVLLGHLSENHHDPRRDNNSFSLARRAVEGHLRRTGSILPPIHRTWRLGRDATGPTPRIDL